MRASALFVLLGAWFCCQTATSQTTSTVPATSVFRDCAECPEMVAIPAGAFMMGSPSSERGREPYEGPRHQVSIRAFVASTHEITFEQWAACVAGGGCRSNTAPPDQGWGRSNRPVINVSWDHAQEYVRWLSTRTGRRYRLLTEAEWEYAARAGTTTPYNTGRSINASQARFGSQQTDPVGSYPPNAFGLHDVHGNVYEWVEDCWNENYNYAPTDGRAWTGGDCQFRVLRGGSFRAHPLGVRSAMRFGPVNRLHRAEVFGFRVARDD